MRLYNIYYICKTCLPFIENIKDVEIKSNSAVTGHRLGNWAACRNILPELRKISCLTEQVDDLGKSLNFYAIERDVPEISEGAFKKFSEAYKKLRSSVQTLINLYESMELGESHPGIDVKIPRCNSLKEYMEYLKEIDFIFSQCPFLQSNEEEIKFNTIDVGSQWLAFNVIAGTGVGFYILNNLAKLVDKAIAVKSHLLTFRQQEEMLETMKAKNEVTKETIDVFQTMKRITMESYVKDLESDIGDLQDGEERGKVEKSLEKLGALLDKGVEIYSSIETPNEIKALFPMSENNAILPDNILKLLEDKKVSDE